MTPVIFGKYEIGLFTDDGRYLSYGRKIDRSMELKWAREFLAMAKNAPGIRFHGLENAVSLAFMGGHK